MGSYSQAYFRIFQIRNPIFETGLPDDLADGRIVHMRYFGKEMMLNLKI